MLTQERRISCSLGSCLLQRPENHSRNTEVPWLANYCLLLCVTLTEISLFHHWKFLHFAEFCHYLLRATQGKSVCQIIRTSLDVIYYANIKVHGSGSLEFCFAFIVPFLESPHKMTLCVKDWLMNPSVF